MDVICFDFDGTLINHDGSIHPRDAEILNAIHLTDTRDQVLFVPATGRAFYSLRQMFTYHGLFVNRLIPLPLVLQNGAELYMPGEILLRHRTFPPVVQASLINMALNIPQATFLLFGLDRVKMLWPNTYSLSTAKQYGLEYSLYRPEDRDLPLAKLMALSEDTHLLQGVAAWARDWPVETSYSMPTFLEFSPSGVDKGSGLRELLEVLNLTDATVYAAGDGENDLPLFKLAERCFVPVQSPPDVQAYANNLIDLESGGLLQTILSYLH